MASRLKTTRRILGVLLLGGIAYAGWLLSRVERPVPIDVQPVQTAAPGGSAPDGRPAGAPGTTPAAGSPADARAAAASAAAESGCADDFVLDWDGGAFRRLDAKRACRDQEGLTALETVVLVLAGRADESGMVVRGAQGKYPPGETAPVLLWGDVEADTEGGLHLVGDEVELLRATSRIISKKPVRFTSGDLNGEAGGMEHDWENVETLLTGDPLIRLVGTRTDGRLVTVRGDTVLFRQRVQQVAARGAGRIEFPGGQIRGDSIEIRLSADGQDIASIAASGHAVTIMTDTESAGGSGPAGPTLRRLEADAIDHAFRSGSRLESIQARGAAQLTGTRAAPTAGGSRTESISANVVDLSFAADGTRLERLEGVGTPAVIAVTDPASSDEASGSKLELRFASDGQVERLIVAGTASVRQVRRAPAQPLTRSIVGETIEAGLQQGRIRDVAFSGTPARLSESGRDASGAAMQREGSAESGTLAFAADGRATAGSLHGHVRARAPDGALAGDSVSLGEDGSTTVVEGRASLETEGRTTHGDRIVHDRAADTLTVSGRQHTIVRPGAAAGGLDVLSRGAEPTYISSDVLTVHLKERQALYTGGRPALRRGDNELMADVIEISETAGILHARGDVRSRLRLSESPTARDEGRQGLFDPALPIEGSSAELRHSRDTREIVYSGTVRLEQAGASLSAADSVHVTLKPERSEVDVLLARGDALFVSPDREGEGEEIEYRAADQRIRVTGGLRPARARDAAGNFARGEILEMTVGNQGIRVLGSAGGRGRGVTVDSGPHGSATSGAAP